MPRDPEHEAAFAANRTWWDGVVPVHEASRGYDREGFLRGEKLLCPVERAELGPLVAGRTLLHLQCHFGMDTLNWARLGADVTGLDFSEPAIDAARRLSLESGIPARFVVADVYDAASAIPEPFDVVYTGIGALCWLPDIGEWARVVAACLRPGGILYVYEGHPMLWTLESERRDGELTVSFPYFERVEATMEESDRTYVDGPPLPRRRTYQWNHGLGEIVTAVIDAGLRLQFVHEHREVAWKALPTMEAVRVESVGQAQDDVVGARYQSDRMWRLPRAQRDLVPLMYSLSALKC